MKLLSNHSPYLTLQTLAKKYREGEQTMEINANKFCAAFATLMFGAIDECEQDNKNDILGLNLNILQQLSELDSRGQRYIMQHAASFLKVNFDADALSKMLEAWWKLREEHELEDEFLCLNAPQKLMRELFGMHASKCAWRRNLLGMQGEGRHRPYYCDSKIEQQIWDYWHTHQDMDERERYLRIVQITGQPISIIFTAVRRYQALSN